MITLSSFPDPRTRSWVVNSITRLVAQIGDLPEYVHSQIALHLASEDIDVQQVSQLTEQFVFVLSDMIYIAL